MDKQSNHQMVGHVQQRQLEILRAIVDEYVATNEPVGSKVLASRHGLGVSAATIRNDMAVLEDAGLIAQPHTSAGRVPTNSGYRVFVDRLQSIKPLSTPERRAIESFMRGADERGLESVLDGAVKMLAQLTHQVAMIRHPLQDKVVIAGTANLAVSINDNAAALHPILEALEEQVVLLKLVSNVGSSTLVRIGEDQPESGLAATSSVAASFGSANVGVLGLTRMDYANSIAAVNAVAKYIGEFFAEGFNG
jgi:transcriptional regulator of heat shock response